MFVQIIRGKTKDPEGVRALGKKGAAMNSIGLLGVTAGVTDDGRTFAAVRFESPEAAQQNSDLPETGEFAAELASLLDGPPEFFNCPDVQLMQGGGDDSAGFVQVMTYKTNDVPGIKALFNSVEQYTAGRADFLGAVTAFADDGKTVFDINYFSSEAEAREGEKAEMPAEMQASMEKFGALIDGEIEYLDIVDPDLH